MNTRFSQTLHSTNAEESKGRKNSLTNCCISRGLALKEPMRGWIHTETYLIGLIKRYLVGRHGTI